MPHSDDYLIVFLYTYKVSLNRNNKIIILQVVARLLHWTAAIKLSGCLAWNKSIYPTSFYLSWHVRSTSTLASASKFTERTVYEIKWSTLTTQYTFLFVASLKYIKQKTSQIRVFQNWGLKGLATLDKRNVSIVVSSV